MEQQKFIDKFLAFEENNNLFDLEIVNFRFWSYIRHELYNKILESATEKGQNQVKVKNNNRFLYVTKNILKILIYKNPFFRKKGNVDLFVFNHPRKVFTNNRYSCIYTDYIVADRNLVESYFILEQSFHNNHLEPVNIYVNGYLDFYDLLSAILAKLKKIKLTKAEQEILTNISQKLQIHFNYFDPSFIFNLIKEVNYLIHLKKLLKYTVKKTSPKTILEVVYYNNPCMLLNEIGEELGIPTIELQHGTMGSLHIAYNFYNRERDYKFFPKYIFLYGKIWDDITRIPKKCIRKIVGFPHLEEKSRGITINRTENNKILFLSQPSIAKQLIELAVEFANSYGDQFGYEIIFKLHPGEFLNWRKLYPKLLSANIKVITNEINLYELFATCSYQVGVYSTSILEGIYFGLTTFIFKAEGYNYLYFLVENKLASLIVSSKELGERINKIDYKIDNRQDFKTYLWEENAVENMKYEIDIIMENYH